MGASLARREEVRLLSAQSNFQPFEDRPDRRNAARSLFAGAGAHGARFAAELLTELANKQRTVDDSLSLEETINAMRRAAKQGPVAGGSVWIFGAGTGSVCSPWFPCSPSDFSAFSWTLVDDFGTLLDADFGDAQPLEIELRLAAVQALRALVPAFPAAWPGNVERVGARSCVMSPCHAMLASSSGPSAECSMSMWADTYDTLVAYKSEGSACKFADRKMGGLTAEPLLQTSQLTH
eukprot:Skav204760  [mRNA]  locus=scaffold1013:266652:269573:+ [translate_table: standard]